MHLEPPLRGEAPPTALAVGAGAIPCADLSLQCIGCPLDRGGRGGGLASPGRLGPETPVRGLALDPGFRYLAFFLRTTGRGRFE